MAFRIGRKFAQHTYPEPPRGGGVSLSFARNFATGPSVSTPISMAGVSVPWVPDVGSPGVNVPITPAVTGVILMSAVVSLANTTGSAATVMIQVQVDADILEEPQMEQFTIPANGFVVFPFLMQTIGTVGVQSLVQIIVTGPTTVNVVADSSSLDLQEVSVSTG